MTEPVPALSETSFAMCGTCGKEPGFSCRFHYTAEIRRLRGALDKIDAIRNSIIGCQNVNWSEHVYPLVAALNEVGYDGESYEAARAKVGTLIERAVKAEDALRTANEMVCYHTMPFGWPDFQAKYGLPTASEVLAAHRVDEESK